jgi:hypothetical protein
MTRDPLVRSGRNPGYSPSFRDIGLEHPPVCVGMLATCRADQHFRHPARLCHAK